jgi:hypothetical protein
MVRKEIKEAWKKVEKTIPEYKRDSIDSLSPSKMIETLGLHAASDMELQGRRDEYYYRRLKSVVVNLMAKLGFHPDREGFDQYLQDSHVRSVLRLKKIVSISNEDKSLDDLINSPSLPEDLPFPLNVDHLLPNRFTRNEETRNALAQYLRAWHNILEEELKLQKTS